MSKNILFRDESIVVAMRWGKYVGKSLKLHTETTTINRGKTRHFEQNSRILGKNKVIKSL
jgi:hypothetical protein